MLLYYLLSVLVSLNTHAAEATNIESSINELVIAQGKQMMNELSGQLQQSIIEEINSFTIDFYLMNHLLTHKNMSS